MLRLNQRAVQVEHHGYLPGGDGAGNEGNTFHLRCCSRVSEASRYIQQQYKQSWEQTTRHASLPYPRGEDSKSHAILATCLTRNQH